MIGKVSFRTGGKKVTLTVADDGTVEGPGGTFQKILAAMIAAGAADYSPAHGAWGVLPLEEFARAVGGKVVLANKRPAGKGGALVY